MVHTDWLHLRLLVWLGGNIPQVSWCHLALAHPWRQLALVPLAPLHSKLVLGDQLVDKAVDRVERSPQPAYSWMVLKTLNLEQNNPSVYVANTWRYLAWRNILQSLFTTGFPMDFQSMSSYCQYIPGQEESSGRYWSRSCREKSWRNLQGKSWQV